MKDFFNDKDILITGCGSLAKQLLISLKESYNTRGIRIYSHSEYNLHNAEKQFRNYKDISYIYGDIRDTERLKIAMKNAGIVIHTAAMKHVDICEKNCFDAVETNIIGTKNVISASMEMNINKAMFISTDKSIYPTNLYGATKMVGEKMWISANIFTPHSTKFSACRYGNVLGSRGSILEIFKEQKEKGEFTITHSMMNRFWISLPKAAEFILQSILETNGSEIFIPKMVSADILTIAKCIDEKCSYKEIGIKTGEKLEECLITEEESVNTKILNDKYVITKSYFNPIPFTYNSKNNPLFIKDKNKFKNLFKEEFNE